MNESINNLLLLKKVQELQDYCNENNPECKSKKLLKTPDEFLPLLKLNGFELVLTTILQNFVGAYIPPKHFKGKRIDFITILNINDTNNLLAYYYKN